MIGQPITISTMPNQQDPKWEVVDEMPGEKRNRSKSQLKKTPLLSKSLWIGIGIGVVGLIFFPALLLIIRRLAMAWWLWIGIGAYWGWKRLKKDR